MMTSPHYMLMILWQIENTPSINKALKHKSFHKNLLQIPTKMIHNIDPQQESKKLKFLTSFLTNGRSLSFYWMRAQNLLDISNNIFLDLF